ncbi:hypothetical protein GGR56DRAFT_639430 [Xylariaceae sp. FL0804]|nr:hypothetical protein GGR56DRAFT_639430 [Xylariaceae sp. FL0804]
MTANESKPGHAGSQLGTFLGICMNNVMLELVTISPCGFLVYKRQVGTFSPDRQTLGSPCHALTSLLVMAPTSMPILLHLVPVISSTSSLWYAWDQYEQLTVFRQPAIHRLSNQILPQYFNAFFTRGVPRVLGLLATTVLSSAVLLRYSPTTALHEQGAFPWYIASISLAIGHMAWAPSIIPPVRAIENDAKDKNLAHLEIWLHRHMWRSLTVDLGAWVCCVIAALKSLQA